MDGRVESSKTGGTGSQGPSASMSPLFVALLVMVVWGGTPLFSKLAVAEMPPLQVGLLRTVLAGLLAAPILAAMRTPLPRDGRRRLLLAVSAFAAFVAFPLVYTFGQQRTSAMHGALILATLPVLTSLFGHVVERRRVSPAWIAGCVLALAGDAAIIVWRTAGASPGTSVEGDVIVLVSAVVCSIGYVAGARLAQSGYPSLATTLWGVALASAVLLPLSAWSLLAQGWPKAGPSAWASVLVLAALTSIAGYVAWYWALARGGIARVASVQFTQPLFGLALAAVVLGETLAPLAALAGAAILAGAWLVRGASE